MTWGTAAADAVRAVCPACQRIEDNFAAGYVTIKGAFLAEHRDEIINVVMARAGRPSRGFRTLRRLACRGSAARPCPSAG
jgi:hypothetical protein